MKYRTLFRMMIKALGVWIFASHLCSLISVIALASITAFNLFQSTSISAIVMTIAGRSSGELLGLLVGIYLFFGGEWIVNHAMPPNHIYCAACGCDVTAVAGNICPECGEPLRDSSVLEPHH